MKKQETRSTLEQHFSKKQLKLMAEFLTMLVKNGIRFFSGDVVRDQIVIKYLNNKAQ
jgi:hypothetical protein